MALRDFAGDGLFTAYNDETNWQLAHDLLMPAFTKSAMQRYHGVMLAAVAASCSTVGCRDGEPFDVARRT